MKTKSLVLLLILIALISCDDFFEKDLTDSELVLQSPTDNFISSVSSITFWWDYLNGAYEYQLQVVSPEFNNPDFLLLDTILAENTYQINLDTGIFQWRVKGMNSSSETPFSMRNIIITEK